MVLHDLDPLSRRDLAPVFRLRVREEVSQHGHSLLLRGRELLCEVDRQVDVLPARRAHGDDVEGIHRGNQVQRGAVLEEVRGEARVGAEEKQLLPADVPPVQVWHGHRGRAHGGLPVALHLMPRNHLRVAAHEKLPRNGETAVARNLRHLRLLQQLERSATCSDEDELGFGGAFCSRSEAERVGQARGGQVREPAVCAGGALVDVPRPVSVLLQLVRLPIRHKLPAQPLERGDETSSERSPVVVAAHLHLCAGHGRPRRPPVH
mmetsp:Transcript_17002/g.42145  ORF Transcript_17002/g.42145 Transcript_17002/m.42145 type:complete len:263 (+) Transcript_17002:875-1663(+)